MNGWTREVVECLTPSRGVSPTHEAIAKGDELKTRKRLGENISKLVLGGNVPNGDSVGNDVGAKMMQADREVFGSWASAMICGDFNATLVVFKHSAVNGGGRDVEAEAARLEFADEVHEADDFAEGGGEGDVLGLSGGEGNKGLHFGGPNDRTTGVHNEVAST